MNPTIARILFIIGTLAYIIWPFDLMPGVPIDDLIVAIIGVAGAIRSRPKRIE